MLYIHATYHTQGKLKKKYRLKLGVDLPLSPAPTLSGLNQLFSDAYLYWFVVMRTIEVPLRLKMGPPFGQ